MTRTLADLIDHLARCGDNQQNSGYLTWEECKRLFQEFARLYAKTGETGTGVWVREEEFPEILCTHCGRAIFDDVKAAKQFMVNGPYWMHVGSNHVACDPEVYDLWEANRDAKACYGNMAEPAEASIPKNPVVDDIVSALLGAKASEQDIEESFKQAVNQAKTLPEKLLTAAKKFLLEDQNT